MYRLLIAFLVLAYPLLVYLGLERFGPLAMALVLAGLLSWRAGSS